MKIIRSYLFEINVGASAPTAGKEISFPQNLGELNRATIYGVEVYSASDINASPTGKTPVSLSGCKSAAIRLYEDSTEQVHWMPLINLIPTSQGGLQREFKPFKINMSKSRLTFFAGTGVNANESVIINFIYEK